MNFSAATDYSNMTNSTASSSVIQHHPSMIKISVYIVLQICSLVGNIALITVIFRTNTLKTAFNYLVVNMAISDLFVPLLLIPYKIGNELRSTPFITDWPVDGTLGDLICRVYWFSTDMSPAVSSFSLVAIATNRFVAIVFPFKVELSNIINEKSKLFIALIWMLAVLLYCPHFYFYRLQERKCALAIFQESTIIYYGFIIFFSFFIPFTIITVEYLMMISKLHRKSESVKDCLNNKQYRSRQRRNKQIFLLSIAIILSFAFLVGPIFCYMFVLNFIFNWDVTHVYENGVIVFVLHIIYIVYTSSNPVIYFVFVKSYRQGLKNLIRGKNPNLYQPSMSSAHHNSLIAKSRL